MPAPISHPHSPGKILPLGAPYEQGDRYARAWVAALRATSEPFGLVFAGSLAAGTPIVLADDAAPPSFVTPATGTISKVHIAPPLERLYVGAE